MSLFLPSRNRVVVPDRQAAYAGGIDLLESTLPILKSLKIRAQMSYPGNFVIFLRRQSVVIFGIFVPL
jgi:hypothetical protein